MDTFERCFRISGELLLKETNKLRGEEGGKGREGDREKERERSGEKWWNLSCVLQVQNERSWDRS